MCDGEDMCGLKFLNKPGFLIYASQLKHKTLITMNVTDIHRDFYQLIYLTLSKLLLALSNIPGHKF